MENYQTTPIIDNNFSFNKLLSFFTLYQ